MGVTSIQYQTKILNVVQQVMFKKLFRMWCKDNSIDRYTVVQQHGPPDPTDPRRPTCTSRPRRLTITFDLPEDAVLFKLANPQWNQIDHYSPK